MTLPFAENSWLGLGHVPVHMRFFGFEVKLFGTIFKLGTTIKEKTNISLEATP